MYVCNLYMLVLSHSVKKQKGVEETKVIPDVTYELKEVFFLDWLCPIVSSDKIISNPHAYIYKLILNYMCKKTNTHTYIYKLILNYIYVKNTMTTTSIKPVHSVLRVFPTQTKKSMGFFTFIFQNQLKKTSVIRLPKLTSINIAKKCHQCQSFSIENPFFENYCFGSLMTDGFFN